MTGFLDLIPHAKYHEGKGTQFHSASGLPEIVQEEIVGKGVCAQPSEPVWPPGSPYPCPSFVKLFSVGSLTEVGEAVEY